MILQALAGYYRRILEESGGEVALEGFERKEIPFVIVLDSRGCFVGLAALLPTCSGTRRLIQLVAPKSTRKKKYPGRKNGLRNSFNASSKRSAILFRKMLEMKGLPPCCRFLSAENLKRCLSIPFGRKSRRRRPIFPFDLIGKPSWCANGLSSLLI